MKGIYHHQLLSLCPTQYFKSLDCTEGPVSCPDSLDIVNKVQIQEKWELNLLLLFWDLYGLQSFVCFHLGSLKDDGTVATNMLSITGSNSLGTSSEGGVSGGGKSGGGLTNDSMKATNTQLDNTHFNNMFFGAYKTSIVKFAVLYKRVANVTIGPLPKSEVDSIIPMCLAWQTKGLCNPNCPCAQDHAHYSTKEYTPMVKWC